MPSVEKVVYILNLIFSWVSVIQLMMLGYVTESQLLGIHPKNMLTTILYSYNYLVFHFQYSINSEIYNTLVKKIGFMSDDITQLKANLCVLSKFKVG